MYIGIDIGGTTVKMGIVNKKGEIFSKISFSTKKSPNEVVLDIKQNIDNLLTKNKLSLKKIKGIGVGCPGTIDSKNGIIYFSCNLGWNNVDFKDMFLKETGYKGEFSIFNDARVATIAEAKFGAGKGVNNFILLTIGTGVGAGIVINKKLYEGALGMAGEIGHVTLVKDGLNCSCGRKGCIEAYASATALINQAKEEMKNNKNSLLYNFDEINGKIIFECAKQNDKTANLIVEKYVEYLGESILSILNVFRPDKLVLAGGISTAGAFLIDKLNKYVQERFYGHKGAIPTDIVQSTLNDNAGIIGAAALNFD
ncbi:MAG: ROK family protein [Clostridiales bacterium]|nr:ROK family protein [Clostridiales bacterium]